MLPLIPIVGMVISGLFIYADWQISEEISGQVSYFDQLLQLIETGATMDEFVQSCWPMMVFFVFFTWICIWVAFPKKRREGVR